MTTAMERFLQKIEVTDRGCWQWTAYLMPNGYGRLRFGRRVVYAHRFAYEQFVGPIPEDHHVDHLCFNRACVNPDHLEAITPLENQRRSQTFVVTNPLKTHCPKNHPYDYTNSRGARCCRRCDRETWRRYDAKRKAA